MKKIKLIIPILALTLFSCSDYLDVNTSPDNPIGSQITPNLNLSAAQTNSFRTQTTRMNRVGNFFMNNWAMNVNAFAVTAPQEFSLEVDNTFYADIWDATYRSTADYSIIINSTAPNYENHKAIAKIMKSHHFQALVDMYGDIPYFDAHKGIVEVTPKYDDDKAIYRDLIVQLNDAIATIDNPIASTIPVGKEDVIMGGDMSAWKRYANTVKLRILLRQSKLTDAETTTHLATEFAKLAGQSFVTADVKINPGYTNGNNTLQNPFYALMFQANETTVNQEFNFIRASKHMGDLLNVPLDPRGVRIFAAVGGNVKGVIQGDKAQSGGGTAPGLISGLGTGLVINSKQDGFIMTLAESLFLQCEAVHRGYLPGTAATLFNAGITASFAQLGAAPGTYITQINGLGNNGRGYTNPAATFDERVSGIMYQKNIALQGGLNAMESFIEHTRTGASANIPLAQFGSTTRANKPRIFLYPNSELIANSANVPNRTLNSIFTTGPFWYVP